MIKEIEKGLSKGFTLAPTVLKQISWSHGLFQKSHGTIKNGEKNGNIYLPHLHLAFCPKKKCLFSTDTTVLFSASFPTEYSSPIEETIEICSDLLDFFYLHNISARETAVSAFTFQIEKT